MFGIIKPCRNRLGDELGEAWVAHLCGTCLALRDEHGHLARLVTNYDAVVISALVEAQHEPDRRNAGPCALRGLRRAPVATGRSARLAAAVSLVLASAKLRDHLTDGDVTGGVRRRAAARVAGGWAAAGTSSGRDLDFDAAALLTAVADQARVESSARTLLEVTAPTEAATALAFAHTAVVAGRPGNSAPLSEVGRLFGRLAHVLDAVEDVAADGAAGRWNPLLALEVSPEQVRRLCDDAVLGIRLALRDVEFADDRLVHALLVHELPRAVQRAFPAAGRPQPPLTPPLPPEQQPDDTPPPPTGWEAATTPKKRNAVVGCLGWLVVCGTCQACCADEYTDPCTGERRQGSCRDCGCPDCPDCSDCADCGDCCDCGDCDCGCDC